MVDIPPRKDEWINPFRFARKLLGESFLDPSEDNSVVCCKHCGDQHNPELCAHAPLKVEDLFEDDLTRFYKEFMVGWDKKEKEEKSLPDKSSPVEARACLFNNLLPYTEEKPSDPSDHDEPEENALECDSRAVDQSARSVVC